MKKFFVFLLILWVFFSFFSINQKNYTFIKKVQAHLVEHPEKLPQAEFAKFSSIGFYNLAADIYWLQTIQYIGWNAVKSEYKKYLYEMMHLITELNPYFESPYVLGQLLIPWGNDMYEDFTQEEQEEHKMKGEKLGLKWIRNFCNSEAIEKIKNEDDLQKIISDEIYKNPCKSYKIPYYLAYIYFYYLKDNLTASQYYKIVSAQEDAPPWARVLAAIMQGKWGERKKSIFMFLSLAQNTPVKDESCMILTSKIEDTYQMMTQSWLPVTGELIKNIEFARNAILPPFSSENENTLLGDTECSNFLIKAIRELSILYLEEADISFQKDFPEEVSAKTPEKLFELWYIDFIPTDYQRYNENEGMIYRYNEDIGRFDYKMEY